MVARLVRGGVTTWIGRDLGGEAQLEKATPVMLLDTFGDIRMIRESRAVTPTHRRETMTYKSTEVTKRIPWRKQRCILPPKFPPEPIKRQQEPPPPMCKAVFDASLKSIPNMEVSDDLTRNVVDTGEWVAGALGIQQGEITLRMHHNQMTGVAYTVFTSTDPSKKNEFDEDMARWKYEAAVKTMTESEGMLHPETACWCIHTLFSLLFRLSHQEFGTVTLKIQNGQLYEVCPAPVIRTQKESTLGRIWRAFFLRC